jgi:hypothetical protein
MDEDADILNFISAARDSESRARWDELDRAMDAADRIAARIVTVAAAKAGELGSDPTTMRVTP